MGLRPFARFVQRRQQHTRQNGDDRYHDEQLNESKFFIFMIVAPFLTVT